MQCHVHLHLDQWLDDAAEMRQPYTFDTCKSSIQGSNVEWWAYQRCRCLRLNQNKWLMMRATATNKHVLPQAEAQFVFRSDVL